MAGQPARSTQIEDVEIYPFNVPLREPFHIALGTISAAENILVRLRTREGVMGWGESRPYGSRYQRNAGQGLGDRKKDLATFVRGRDPFTLEARSWGGDGLDLVRPTPA